MNDISDEDLTKIKEIFVKYDINDNDTLSWDEFCKMTDDLDSGVSLVEKTDAFRKVDTNNTGMISFEEFVAWWTSRS